MGHIRVSGLGKAYKQYSGRWSRLAEWVVPGSRVRHVLKWVLRDVSFEVRPGEAVGIIGINGAGKSTLLKMITGTTQPTTGNVAMTGRVAALLELGMGFHSDFTGRQNAFMAAQLLGLTVEDIARLMPEIEAFAEIGDYIDQPVRVYSSGMQVRLAFSVATAVRPDVLIVDEALSVGDAYFQHKSFERIRQFRKQGTTLLIVSHDKHAIQSICDRAILLAAGQVAMEGEPEAVMDYYNALLASHQDQSVRQETMADGRSRTQSGSGEASITQVSLLNSRGDPVETIGVGDAVSLRVDIRCNQELEDLVVGYLIKDRLGLPIFGTNTFLHGQVVTALTAGTNLAVLFDFQANLGPGSYSVAVALHRNESHVSKNYEWRDYATVFSVANQDKIYFQGVSWVPPTIRWER